MGIIDKIADLFGRKEKPLERQPEEVLPSVPENSLAREQPRQEEPAVARPEDQPVRPVARRKKQRTCGVCGKSGHNSRTCPSKK